jgi:hypothetical protein
LNVPNFHDGHFDGFWIAPDEAVHLFLRTLGGERFTLILRGVERLSLDEIKGGNIIVDLVFRDAEQLTTSDMEGLYDADVGSPQAVDLLKKARERGLRVLEINPSYGALGLFLFQTSEMRNTNTDPFGAVRACLSFV